MNSEMKPCLITPVSDELALIFAISFNLDKTIYILDHKVIELRF